MICFSGTDGHFGDLRAGRASWNRTSWLRRAGSDSPSPLPIGPCATEWPPQERDCSVRVCFEMSAKGRGGSCDVGCAYLTSCLRFSSSPSSAQRNCSTRVPGIVSTISPSSSWGPKLGRLLGNASVNRERNMTMNWGRKISASGLQLFCTSAQARRFASRPCSHANRGANTYRNVWIVGQDIFMRRGGLSLRSGRRRFFGLQGRVLVDLVEELQDAVLLLQLNARLIFRRWRRQRRDRREIRGVIFGHFSRRRGCRLCWWSRFVDGVEGRAGRKWVEEGGGVTEIGCEKLRTGQQWSTARGLQGRQDMIGGFVST